MNLPSEFRAALQGKDTPKIGEKLTRAAFLYMDHSPKSPADEFAQCDTCRMFVPAGEAAPSARCVVLGSKFKVIDEGSCGLYSVWPKGKPDPTVVRDHAVELSKGLPASVTPEEAGYVERQVRCENCTFLRGANECGLYDTLNKTLPGLFQLDIHIDPHGCCNAQTPPGGKA